MNHEGGDTSNSRAQENVFGSGFHGAVSSELTSNIELIAASLCSVSIHGLPLLWTGDEHQRSVLMFIIQLKAWSSCCYSLSMVLFHRPGVQQWLESIKYVVNISWYVLNDGCLRLLLWLFMVFNGHYKDSTSLSIEAPRNTSRGCHHARRTPESSRRFPRTAMSGCRLRRTDRSFVIDEPYLTKNEHFLSMIDPKIEQLDHSAVMNHVFNLEFAILDRGAECRRSRMVGMSTQLYTETRCHMVAFWKWGEPPSHPAY